MCALATLDLLARMGQQHVHLANLANINQWQDLLNVRGVRPASFLLSLLQFRMSVLAMLEQLDPTGMQRVHCVILENTRQQQDLLNLLCVRAASFRQ